MFDVAASQDDGGQMRILGEDAFLKEAIVQLEVDFRTEISQVKSATDPSPPKPKPTQVGVGRELTTQDVSDHSRPAGPGVAPRSHRGLVNHLIFGSQVEPFSPADMIDQQ
jgi:hypothetical protein